ncbi:hypothetical protein NTCA1_31470 [Novosphingobium sp. TCA1]|nr:hypothetical protein NTCA1_31470 [Novosphingobium sp. TCA1]
MGDPAAGPSDNLAAFDRALALPAGIAAAKAAPAARTARRPKLSSDSIGTFLQSKARGRSDRLAIKIDLWRAMD